MNEIDEVVTRVKQYECVCSTDDSQGCWHLNPYWSWPTDSETLIPWLGSGTTAQPIARLKLVNDAGEAWHQRLDGPEDPELREWHRADFGVTEYITDGSYPF